MTTPTRDHASQADISIISSGIEDRALPALYLLIIGLCRFHLVIKVPQILRLALGGDRGLPFARTFIPADTCKS